MGSINYKVASTFPRKPKTGELNSYSVATAFLKTIP